MIRNITNKKIISRDRKVLKTTFAKARGLMFKHNVEQALVFEFSKPRKDIIHMLFVFCSIDLVFLDEKLKVIELKEDFRPWQFFAMKKPASFLLELPEGTIKQSKTKLGDEISIEDS